VASNDDIGGRDEDAAGGAQQPEPPLAARFRKIDRLLGTAEAATAAGSLLLLVFAGVYQFVAAKFLGKNQTWPVELIRYSVFFIATAGAALAAQKSQMFNMDVVTRLLRPKARAKLRIATSVIAAAACALLAWGGMAVRSTPVARDAPYEYIPAQYGLLALPICAALIGLHFLIHATIDAAYLASGQEPPEGEKAVH